MLEQTAKRVGQPTRSHMQGQKDPESKTKRTTPGIPRWSPTPRVLVWRLSAYLWESGRDPEFSDIYGRTWRKRTLVLLLGLLLRREMVAGRIVGH
ncbi:hypothetical protein GE09DRAFT_462968 [Coniochaeta sp. 2T2.1]|nr:hypothetical protein GE09DRAFT_462968 [Coniochaeta sp. 2T2.1]